MVTLSPRPVVLNKAAVGLGNVDNTSDANKPVSTAQAAALALKLNASVFDGLTKITVSTVQPATPNPGDLWIDTN